MRVRQCRLSGRRVPGIGFCVWRSDSNRYSGSALASCLPCWLCQLMHYSTHLTRKRELSYTTTDRALDARMALVASTGFRLVQCSFLLCRYEKAPHDGEALNFWWFYLKASIDPVCDVYLFPHHLALSPLTSEHTVIMHLQNLFSSLFCKFLYFRCQVLQLT